jgi:hypothetical protein
MQLESGSGDRMGLFSFLTDAHFSAGADGEIVFRWWSPLPRAYIVPGEVTKRRLSTRLAAAQWAGIILIACTCGSLANAHIDKPSVLFFVALNISVLVHFGTTLLLAPVLRGLQPFPGAPVMLEQWRIMSDRLTYAQLWLNFLGYLSFAAIGVFIATLSTLLLPIGVIDVLLFGGCSLCFAYMLGFKRRATRL